MSKRLYLLLKYKHELKIKEIEGKHKVFDPIRKRWYVLRPEEFVRQLVIIHLHTVMAYPYALIGVEKQLKVHGMKRRFDLVVFDKSASPHILVECKSPKEKLNESTSLQIANYNMALKANYLWLSNGSENFFYRVDYRENEARRIKILPRYGSGLPS